MQEIPFQKVTFWRKLIVLASFKSLPLRRLVPCISMKLGTIVYGPLLLSRINPQGFT